jgi:predicted small integral membrane protein
MTYLRTIVIESVALLGSLGTLVCCALPALLVSLGAGAAMASLVTNVPQLVWLSVHKVPLFMFAAIMLVMSGVTMFDNRRLPCPADPVQAKSCRRVRKLSAGIFFTSLVLYVIGFYFAFIALKIA